MRPLSLAARFRFPAFVSFFDAIPEIDFKINRNSELWSQAAFQG
ncbi:hypothetical protein ABIE89_000568 [Bradyrhizobium niftali]